MKAKMWFRIGVFCLVAAVYGQVDIQEGVGSRIGYGFLLWRKDILGVFTGGASVFKTVPANCVRTVDGTKAERLTTYYDSTKSFFQRVTGDTRVSESLQGRYTMGATLNIKSRSISNTLTVIGTSLWMAVYLKLEILSKNCENSLDLNDNLIRDFENLPHVVRSPEYRSSWDAFDAFLTTYGSHLVTETSFGAYLEQWTFAKSEKRYSQSQMEARACGDFAGTTQVGKLNVSVCSGFSSTKINSAQSLDTSRALTVKGGDVKLATALLSDRTSEKVEKFLNSARQDAPVAHKFKSVAELLKQRYINTPHYRKALNLQFYYEGFLDYECNAQRTPEGKLVRRFVRDEDYSDSRPSYKCEIPSQGCQTHDDCHLGGWGSTCFCYGNSCFGHKSKQVAGRTIPYIEVQKSQSGAYDEGLNKCCHYQVGPHCACDKGWRGSWRKVWASGDVSVAGK